MGKTFGEFMDYFSVCYRRSRGSIFIGGFVGGMFLSFLMDESDKCHDRSFTQAFFIIGITHFLSNLMGGAASYAKEASQADADITLFERKIQLLMVFLQHVMKIAQYPLVFWLGFYVIKFNTGTVLHESLCSVNNSMMQAIGHMIGEKWSQLEHRVPTARSASATGTLSTWRPWCSSSKLSTGSSLWDAWCSCGMLTPMTTSLR